MSDQGSRARIVACAAALALASAPAFAHHGWSSYERTPFELTGVVETAVRLGGAHATMRIRANGQVWDVVLAPERRSARAGLKDGLVPIGAQVTASGHRHRDPKKFEIKTERLTWNGKVYNVYPDRD
jgi:hypothetical protein